MSLFLNLSVLLPEVQIFGNIRWDCCFLLCWCVLCINPFSAGMAVWLTFRLVVVFVLLCLAKPLADPSLTNVLVCLVLR